MIIKITCQGADLVDIRELKPLQGNLKHLEDVEYKKLKRSLETYGYTFPAFTWKDVEENFWIIDAHQRNKICLLEDYDFQQQDGTISKQVPVVYIDAADKTEAKQKILLFESRYGKLTHEGFSEFIFEPDSMIDVETMTDMLNIQFDFSPFEDFANSIPVLADLSSVPDMNDLVSTKSINETDTIKCPKCGADTGYKKRGSSKTDYEDKTS